MCDKKELKPIGLFGNDGCMKKFRIVAALACAAGLASCGLIEEAEFRNNDAELWSFGQDLSFFSKYGVESFVLGEEDSLIVVSPLLQGRVMTSTYGGAAKDLFHLDLFSRRKKSSTKQGLFRAALRRLNTVF